MLKRSLFFLILSLTSSISNLFGQYVPDSFDPVELDSAYHIATEIETKLEILMRLGEVSRAQDVAKANEYYKEVIMLGEPQGQHLFCSKASLMMAVNAQMQHQLDSSLLHLNGAVQYAKAANDTAFEIFLLNNKALILTELGKAFEGAQILTQTLAYAKSKKDTPSIIQGITNLANLKGSTEDLKGTLNFINKEQAYWSMADSYAKAKILYVRGTAQFELNNMQAALADYQCVYPIYKERAHKLNFVLLLNNYATALIELERIDSALIIANEALELSKAANFSMGLGHAYINKGNIFLALEQIDSAAYNNQLALSYCSRTQNPNAYLLALESAKAIHSQKEDWKKANFYGDEYLRVKDSLDHIARLNSMDSLLIANDVEGKEKALEEALSEKKGLLRIKENLMFYLLISFALMVLLGLLIYRKQKSIKHLANSNEFKEIEINDTRNELEQKLLELAQKEKNIKDLEKKVDALEIQNKPLEAKLATADVFNILSRNLKKESDWELFHEYFQNANPKFFSALKNDFPKLTPHDLRLLALVKLNLAPAEIAVLFNIAEDSVRKAKYRISKKLELAGDKHLHGFILRY